MIEFSLFLSLAGFGGEITDVILCFLNFVSFSLDIGVYLRYIKCINNVNTLLTYLVQYMLRFPEVFEDLAALAVE